MELTPEQIEKLRQSGIRLDGDGRFWHEGQEVTHQGLRAAFFRWLDRNPDGRYVLRLDERRFVYLEVDDAPLIVRTLRFEGDRAHGVLSDGSEQAIELATLTLEHDRAYVRVRNDLPARLSNAAWTALGERIVDDNGRPTLHLGDQRIAIG